MDRLNNNLINVFQPIWHDNDWLIKRITPPPPPVDILLHAYLHMYDINTMRRF